jgi:hypothetical protein
MINKVIASMLRFFHALFWLLLFGGILLSHSLRVSTLCTVLVLMGILLWDILGYCFISIWENQFDPPRYDESEKAEEKRVDDASVLERYNIPLAGAMGHAFKFFIYLVLFVGLFRIYGFLQTASIQ